MDIDDIVEEAKRRDAEIQAEQGVVKPSTPVDLREVLLKPEAGVEEEEEKDEKEPGKLAKTCRFLGMILSSVLNRLAFMFNRWSRDYRYVAFVLKGEKQRLKERLMNELENEEDFQRVRETIFNNEVTREVQQVQTQADVDV